MQKLFSLLFVEVANPDAADQAFVDKSFQSLPSFLNRDILNCVDTPISWVDWIAVAWVLRVFFECDGPVDKVQVKVVGAKVFQALLDGLLDVFTAMISVP